ncbi:hypothetical protein KGM_203111 [Danaus plexippus plexippus]|uniref:Uncharacterized protein n=1 Tax=Danaus plexippus plexippus TaxID=278856 RepID=A0A212F467_DANPL|nr:hypothetical protein KGM_203111 [Danaus plexippus plexippus]
MRSPEYHCNIFVLLKYNNIRINIASLYIILQVMGPVAFNKCIFAIEVHEKDKDLLSIVFDCIRDIKRNYRRTVLTVGCVCATLRKWPAAIWSTHQNSRVAKTTTSGRFLLLEGMDFTKDPAADASDADYKNML